MGRVSMEVGLVSKEVGLVSMEVGLVSIISDTNVLFIEFQANRTCFR